MNREYGNLKKTFFEPVAPYFVTTYNTLISVVQGVALAALFYIITKVIDYNHLGFNKLGLLVVGKVLIAFLIICLGWHSYITHNQYLAWQIGVRDTLIPMVFALLQIFLILSILEENIFYFSLCMAAVFGGGFVAYLNSMYQHARPETETMYKEHFACLGDSFAHEFFLEVYAFEKKKMIEMLFMTLLSAVLTISIYEKWVDPLVVIVIYITSFAPLYWRNLRNHLRKTENLKKYGIAW